MVNTAETIKTLVLLASSLILALCKHMVTYVYEATTPPRPCYLVKDDPRQVALPDLLHGLRHTQWYKKASPLEKETMMKSLKDHFSAENIQNFWKSLDAVADSFGKAVRAEKNPLSVYNNQAVVISIAYTLLSEALKHPSKTL